MNVTRLGARESQSGPADWFTGQATIDEIATGSPTVRAVLVTFAPGARTAWHTHPRGQTLHILSGLGRVQCAGKPPIEVRPGDTVWIEPNERHWHGAAPNHTVCHLAFQEAGADAKFVAWQEQVSDRDYVAAPGG